VLWIELNWIDFLLSKYACVDTRSSDIITLRVGPGTAAISRHQPPDDQASSHSQVDMWLTRRRLRLVAPPPIIDRLIVFCLFVVDAECVICCRGKYVLDNWNPREWQEVDFELHPYPWTCLRFNIFCWHCARKEMCTNFWHPIVWTGWHSYTLLWHGAVRQLWLRHRSVSFTCKAELTFDEMWMTVKLNCWKQCKLLESVPWR